MTGWMLAIIFAVVLVVGSTSLLRQHRLWPESQYLKHFLDSAFGRRVLLYQHSWPSHEQMLGPWATLFGFPSWYSSAAQSTGLLKVASLSAAPLRTAPSGVSSHHSDTDKHWQACGLCPGSLCSQANPTINNHGVSAVCGLLSAGYKSYRPLPHSQPFPGVCKLTRQNRIPLSRLA